MCLTPVGKRKFDTENALRHPEPIKKQRVNAVNEVKPDEAADPETRCESFIYAISDNHDELVWCKVGNVLIEMMIDSGSRYNIIDEATWVYLKNREAVMEDIRPSTKSLSAYAQNGQLNIVCTFNARITVVDTSTCKLIDACFFVVKEGKQNLLGRETAKQLGVLLIGLPSVINSGCIQHLTENVEKFPTIKG